MVGRLDGWKVGRLDSYIYKDGRDDDMEGLQTSGRCMARALSFLLQEGEGIVIELPFQPDYPNDPHGKFIVAKENGFIGIAEYHNDENIVWDDDGNPVEPEDGDMMWLHNEVDDKVLH